jgi:hypothetical protein
MAGIAAENKMPYVLAAGNPRPRPPEGDSGGEDQDILQHLLEVEANAQALVDDAQAEADRRIAGIEKQNRARYEEAYTREAALLDSRCKSGLEVIKDGYRKQLDDYRLSLDDFKPDYAGFCRLLDSFLEKGR